MFLTKKKTLLPHSLLPPPPQFSNNKTTTNGKPVCVCCVKIGYSFSVAKFSIIGFCLFLYFLVLCFGFFCFCFCINTKIIIIILIKWLDIWLINWMIDLYSISKYRYQRNHFVLQTNKQTNQQQRQYDQIICFVFVINLVSVWSMKSNWWLLSFDFQDQ